MTILDTLHQLRSTLRKRFIITFIISVIVAIATAFYFYQQPTTYVATSIIFPLSANSAKGSSSPISQLQEQFGIDGPGPNEIYDVNELVRSKRISFEVVNKKPVNKKYNHLYEWLVADYNSELGWRDEPIKLGTHSKDSLTNLIVGRGLLLNKVKVDVAKNDYTTIEVEAFEKELGRDLNESILLTLSEFYIQFVTEKPRSDLEKIQVMRDSLSVALSAIEKAKAGVVDKSTYGVFSYVGLPMIKLERREREIQSIYATTVNALQNARFKLLSESPIFQILDYPGEPYITKKVSWKPKAVIAFVLAFFLLSFWFTRKIFINLIIVELKKA